MSLSYMPYDFCSAQNNKIHRKYTINTGQLIEPLKFLYIAPISATIIDLGRVVKRKLLPNICMVL